MAWDGYIQYGGNEIINVSRSEAYARWAGLPWFKPVYDNDSLGPMLGDGNTYISPAQDRAPWTDPSRPESYAFYGCYPLDISGLEASSRTSVVTESTGDGGVAGRLRHGTKPVVFNTVLFGENDAAVDFGFMWLKQALLPGPCGPGGWDCAGSDLCYLSSEPAVDLEGNDVVALVADPSQELDGGTAAGSGVSDYDGGDVLAFDGGGTGGGGTDTSGGTAGGSGADADGGYTFIVEYDGGGADKFVGRVEAAESVNLEECLAPLIRSLRKVTVNSGPTVTSKRVTTDGGAAWTVTFTAVAGEPWEYGGEVEVIEGFLDPDVAIPWVGGEIPEGGYVDPDGHSFVDTPCAKQIYDPIQDPQCLAVIPPPLPPSVSMGCYSPPSNWRRRQITIPRTYIPLWGEVVPKFSVHARNATVRNLRLRFYADVDGDGDTTDDPCAFCGDLVVSYVPKGSTLVFDTTERQVYIVDSNQIRRSANQLVYSTDGTPFDWPVLTCGMGYVVTLDLPSAQVVPVFDLSLFSRVA